MTLLFACLSMAVRDAIGTILVVAEAKGRPVLAGALDAAGDLAGIAVIVFGAGDIIANRRLTLAAAIVLGAMCVTSFATTYLATQFGRRL